MSSYIPVGKIIKPHGLKGALKCRPYNPTSHFYEYAPVLYLEKDGERLATEIKQVQFFKDLFILTFSKITTVEQALLFRGAEIFVERDAIPLNDDEILFSDMISFEAFFNGKQLGKVSAITNYGAGDIYVVESSNGKKYLLPDQDQFIQEIDYQGKKIIFQDIDILL